MALQTSHLSRLMHRNAHDPGLRALLLDHLELLATIDDAVLQKRLLKELVGGYVRLERRVDALLKNTLPPTVAEIVKSEGSYAPRRATCTILFTDFVGFTGICEALSSDAVVATLADLFGAFDDLIGHHGGTKIKTIGDAYMAAFGVPEPMPEHAAEAIAAAWDMLDAVADFNRTGLHRFAMRVGLHTGEVTAGVVGHQRMQFDIFGDTVNIAARFEAAGAPGRINVSRATCLAAQNRFTFLPRGEIALKNKAAMPAYFVTGKTPELRAGPDQENGHERIP